MFLSIVMINDIKMFSTVIDVFVRFPKVSKVLCKAKYSLNNHIIKAFQEKPGPFVVLFRNTEQMEK